MIIKESTIEELDKISAQLVLSQFLQSSLWAKVCKSGGEEIKILKVVEGEKILAIGLFIRKKLIGKKYYWYCPRGPVLLNDKFPISNFQKYFLYDKDCIFVRIEPTQKIDLRGLKSVKEIQPQHTLVIDLSPKVRGEIPLASVEVGRDGNEILSAMHQKTRYNIRLAEKKDLVVCELNNGEGLNHFWQLSKIMSKRQKINIHSFKHYQKLLKLFGEHAHLLIAFHQNQPIASSLLVGWGDTMTYLHGASDDDKKEMMAPYLVQWQGILLAKKLGFKFYDFYGVAPEVSDGQEFNNFKYDSNHPWAGVSRFKFGFGGRRVNFIGTYDLILNGFWYNLYQYLRRLNLKVRKILK